MGGGAVGRQAVGPQQQADGHVRDPRAVGADVGALVVVQHLVDGEQAAVGVHRGADMVGLLARVVGGHHVLAPVLDPLHRAAQAEGGEADQQVLGVDLAPHAEAAADVVLVELHGRGGQVEELRQPVAVPVRALGGAVQLQHAPRRVEAGEQAAGLQHHRGMAADGEVELHHMRGRGEGGVDLAVALADHGRFGRQARRPVGGGRDGGEGGGQVLDLHHRQLGRVLGAVGVVGDDQGHRLADVADHVAGEGGLAVGLQPLDGGGAEGDRGQGAQVRRRPDGDDAGGGAGLLEVDGDDAAVGVGGADHAGVQLSGEGEIGDEAALAADQGRVLQPGDRAADPAAAVAGLGGRRVSGHREPRAPRRSCAGRRARPPSPPPRRSGRRPPPASAGTGRPPRRRAA